MRMQTGYDEYLERPYGEHESGRLYTDEEPLERDPDDWRDEMRERHRLEREEEA